MATIVTRAGKGSPLTNTEVDANFTNLNNAKYEAGNNVSVGTLAASGAASFSAGSASAPAITATGDLNTGMFFPAADTMAFAEGGVESMRLDSTGRLGIGTTSPQTILTFGGTVDRGISVERNPTTDSAGVRLTVQSGGATSGATDKNGGNLILSSGIATGSGGSAITFATATGGAAGTTDRNATQKMILDGTGSLGIGATVPSSYGKLALEFTEATDIRTWVRNNSADAAASVSHVLNAAGNSWAIRMGSIANNSNALDFISDVSSPSLRMRLTTGGNLGIQTSGAPTNILSLGGNTARTFWMERHTTADTAGNSLTVQAGGATSGATDKNGGNLSLSSGIATGAGGSAITFNTATPGGAGTADRGPTQKMILNSAGNLGVGATPGGWASSARVLDFAFPSFGMDTAGSGFMGFNALNSTGTSWNYKSNDEAALFTATAAGTFTWRQAGTGTAGNAITWVDSMILDGSGRLGIGTTTPGQALHVRSSNAGAIFVTNDATAANNAGVLLVATASATAASRSAAISIDANGGDHAGSDYLSLSHFGDNHVELRNYSNGFLGIWTNNIERMRLTAAGDVGINETAPDYKLDVNGTFGFTPGSSVTPVDNGDVVIEATNNTTLTFKLKGSDGTVRTGTITLS